MAAASCSLTRSRSWLPAPQCLSTGAIRARATNRMTCACTRDRTNDVFESMEERSAGKALFHENCYPHRVLQTKHTSIHSRDKFERN